MSPARALSLLLVAQLGLAAWSHAPRSEAIPPAVALFADGTDAIESLRITGEAADAEPVVLTRQGQGWQITSAHDYPAQTDKVDELLTQLAGIKLSTPVATTAAAHESLRVSETAHDRRIDVEAGGQTTTLWLGAAKRNATWLRKEGSDAIYEIPQMNVYQVRDSERGFEPADHIAFTPSEIQTFTLTNAQGTLALERADAGWHLADDEARVLSQDAIDKLLESASHVRLNGVAGTEPTEAMGLGAQARAQVYWSVEQGDQTLSYGYAIGATEGNDVYVKSDSSPFIVRAPAFKLNDVLNFDPASLTAPLAADSTP